MATAVHAFRPAYSPPPAPAAASQRSLVLQQAMADARPELIQIDEAIIAAASWPSLERISEPITVDLPPAVETPAQAMAFILIANSLNYRFWRQAANGDLVRYHFNGLRGARAMWAACIAAWGNDPTPDTFRQRFFEEGVRQLLGDIPSPETRTLVLKEALIATEPTALELLYWVEDTAKATVKKAKWLGAVFPNAYGDPYLKKAQLALAMFAGTYSRRWGMPIDNSDLTAFADYQVPRVLRALGVLRYAPGLAAKVDSSQMVYRDSMEERALRSATVLACELIAKHLGCTAAQVDSALWHSQEIAGDSRFHLTPTTAY